MGSPVDVSSAKPSVVTMTDSEGVETEVTRTPLRDVFCTECGESVGEDHDEHKCTTAMPYRLSWWHSKEFTPFELHTPW